MYRHYLNINILELMNHCRLLPSTGSLLNIMCPLGHQLRSFLLHGNKRCQGTLITYSSVQAEHLHLFYRQSSSLILLRELKLHQFFSCLFQYFSGHNFRTSGFLLHGCGSSATLLNSPYRNFFSRFILAVWWSYTWRTKRSLSFLRFHSPSCTFQVISTDPALYYSTPYGFL